MLNIAILDDDICICSEIESILLQHLKNYYLKFNIDIFYNGNKFIEQLEYGEKYDILFLDIEIGDLTGLDIGKYVRETLKDEIMKIIYISSHTSYAIKLFKVRPTHFLVKPIKKEEFIDIINILLNLINSQYEYFEFNLDFNIRRVYLKDIIYFNTIKESKKIMLRTPKKDFIFYGRIKEIYNFLKEYRFIQPFNSYIVNYDYVKNIEKDKIILFNGEEVPLSRYKIKEIKSLQIKFMKEM